MFLSQKSQYAVRAVFELAKREGEGPVKAARIAEVEYIPVRFLENILAQLRQAGIVESVRGKAGGYRLRRRSKEITVGEIIRLVQGSLSAINCTSSVSGFGKGCPLSRGCVLLPLWQRAHGAMMDVYDGTTFQDLVDQEAALSRCEVIDYAI